MEHIGEVMAKALEPKPGQAVSPETIQMMAKIGILIAGAAALPVLFRKRKTKREKS